MDCCCLGAPTNTKFDHRLRTSWRNSYFKAFVTIGQKLGVDKFVFQIVNGGIIGIIVDVIVGADNVVDPNLVSIKLLWVNLFFGLVKNTSFAN